MNEKVDTRTTLADMTRREEWMGRFLARPANLPFSFVLGGETIRGIPEEWAPTARTRSETDRVTVTEVEGCDPKTGLKTRVECVAYADYPVLEWTAWLTNAGRAPTPILTDLLGLDADFAGQAPLLWHCNGDYFSEIGYMPEESELLTGEPLRHTPRDGRCCDHAFPYYRLGFEGCGLTLAIGWPGQWFASFLRTGPAIRIRAGQEQTHLRLLPGETIRTPRMALMAWSGDSTRAANLWRRWHRDHLLPRPNGQPLGPKLVGIQTGEGEEFTGATEENQRRFLAQWTRRGLTADAWWIDAGWYPCRDEAGVSRWKRVGTWDADPQRFPHGLKPVSDCVERQGGKFLLWFEPERVHPASRLQAEHPDWVLHTRHPDPWAEGSGLLNLGKPDCRRWLTDHVCRLIREYGIGIYRQDFNIKPLMYWRDNEADDRQGMNENLHVQGYLQFWDDLLARNPGLWIDACASGGRRNDLETMRRSVPLHYSDHSYGDHPVKVAFQRVMFEWLPYFKDCTLTWDVDPQDQATARRIDTYAYHCSLAPMFMPSIDAGRDDFDYEHLKKLLGIWRRAAEMMLSGDFYPLTANHRSAQKWVVRQFDCPEEQRGFIQGLRHPSCPQATCVAQPKALRPEANYVFENAESGEIREVRGSAIQQDGFTLACGRREGALWFYQAN